MNRFVIVRTDTCTAGDVRYVVNTSINAFVYRIEVFKNEVLIDTIEVNCATEHNQEMNYQFFVDTYQEAHKAIRDKYCQVKKNHISKNKVIFEKKENTYNGYKKNTNILKKVIAWVAVCGVIMYLFIVKIFIYSDLYIDTFFSLKEEKIVYLEKVESETHKLEKECMLLPKKQFNTQSIVTVKSCQKWCDKGIIGKEKCDLFLAYFFTKINIKKTNEHKNKIVTSYEVFPKEDTIELNVSQIFHLKVHNKSTHQIFVTLTDIILDHSNNEEIVQFEKAEISFLLQAEEKKAFHIFLEPSYYKQFKLGKYTGSLLFDVKYQNKSIGKIKKQFYFTVK